MASDIVDTIREFVSDLRERTTVPPGPAPRIISRQEWQDMAFPDTESGYAPGSIGAELDRMETAINEASRQFASAFGMSVGEVANQIRRMTDDGRFNWNNPNEPFYGAPDPNRQERARELLLSLLDDKQREMYQQYGCFVAVGSKTGDHYLIYTANNYNVYNISTGWRYCATARSPVPFCDTLASQLLMIECEEEAFLSVANRGGNSQHTFLRSAAIDLPESVAKKLIADAPKREEPKRQEFTVTHAPRIGVRFTDGGRYHWASGREVMQGYADGIREPPRPIRLTVSGPCTLRNYNLIRDLRQSGNCISIEETGSLLAGPIEFRAVLALDTMAGVNTLLNELRQYEGLSIFGEQPLPEVWQDCGNPDCSLCQEVRVENPVPRPIYHPAFLPPYRDPRSLLSHLNEIRTVSREVAGYGSTYDRPELREIMRFFDIPLSLEHDVIRWAEECLP